MKQTRVTALGFGDCNSDAIRLNHLVDMGYDVVAVNTSHTFNTKNKKYSHSDHDFKLKRGIKAAIESTSPNIIFLDYFWLQNNWYRSVCYSISRI